MRIKLKKINILILCCYYKTEIHYFQNPNFIDSVLNKTQNTKWREGFEIWCGEGGMGRAAYGGGDKGRFGMRGSVECGVEAV